MGARTFKSPYSSFSPLTLGLGFDRLTVSGFPLIIEGPVIIESPEHSPATVVPDFSRIQRFPGVDQLSCGETIRIPACAGETINGRLG